MVYLKLFYPFSLIFYHFWTSNLLQVLFGLLHFLVQLWKCGRGCVNVTYFRKRTRRKTTLVTFGREKGGTFLLKTVKYCSVCFPFDFSVTKCIFVVEFVSLLKSASDINSNTWRLWTYLVKNSVWKIQVSIRICFLILMLRSQPEYDN